MVAARTVRGRCAASGAETACRACAICQEMHGNGRKARCQSNVWFVGGPGVMAARSTSAPPGGTGIMRGLGTTCSGSAASGGSPSDAIGRGLRTVHRADAGAVVTNGFAPGWHRGGIRDGTALIQTLIFGHAQFSVHAYRLRQAAQGSQLGVALNAKAVHLPGQSTESDQVGQSVVLHDINSLSVTREGREKSKARKCVVEPDIHMTRKTGRQPALST